MNLCTLSHKILATYYRFKAKSFAQSFKSLEVVQRSHLEKTLRGLENTEVGRAQNYASISSYEDFCQKFPLTQYRDWQGAIDRQRGSKASVVCSQVQRFEPTSGSTFERKWIPYSAAFLAELNSAASVWLGDLYKQYPLIQKGRHYWSISWIPEDLRGLVDSQDTQLFPWWQKHILESMMLMNPAVQKAPSSESAWHSTLMLLGSGSDLSFISVWSPTYLIKIIRGLYEHRESIAEALKRGHWGPYQKELCSFTAPTRADFPRDKNLSRFIQKLWPQLALVSCWTSSTSAIYAKELQELLPQVPMQGKGLWATEGVVSIPWQSEFPLAIQSHFLEFIHLENQKVYPSWQLQKGWVVHPVLTNSTGLLRYVLPDRVLVTGFVGQNPTIEFLGRMGGTDLVGEKMDFSQAEEVLTKLRRMFGINKIYLVACASENKPRYALAVQAEAEDPSSSWSSAMEEALETSMLQYHHYRVAREMGQLHKAKVIPFSNEEEWLRLSQKSGIAGQNKPEALVLRPLEIPDSVSVNI